MAKVYQFREIQRFLEIEIGEEYSTISQKTLQLSQVDSDDTIHSIIRFLGESSHPDFFRYHVIHETIRPYIVRFDNIRRNEVILIEEFDIYIPKNKSYLWADSKQNSLNELLRRIRDAEREFNRDFNYKERKVDLAKMGKACQPDITGGHFRELDIADVQAASIFGPGVGESEDWHRYEDSGEISAIVTQKQFYGTNQRIMITKNGGIVLYSNLSEKDGLELVELVNDTIGPFIITSND